MTIMRRLLAAAALIAAFAACSGEKTAGPGATPDSGRVPDAAPVPLPTWRLEDIQPQSPRTGQTYGLDTFSGKIVVVTLVEGF
jgi:hypothetical protein